MTRTITSNVTNVLAKSYGDVENSRKPSSYPAVHALEHEAREQCKALAFEIGESLKTMSGDRGAEPHKSAGFHRRVARLMPEILLREALMATRDALEQRRSGRGGLRSDPGAFFAGAVKELARREGIDLGLKPSARRIQEAPAEKVQPAETPPEAVDPPVSHERAKEFIQEILDRLAASRR
jgi:hypothetical protein